MALKKKILTAGIKSLVLLLVLVCSSNSWGQIITAGKITYERRTNLVKKLGDPQVSSRIPKDKKIRKENFVLSFNEKKSSFKPIIDDVAETHWVQYLTSQNTYYQDLEKKEQLIMLSFIGKEVPIKDSLPVRNWKITKKKRTIGGYECTRAIYEKNDTTRIYAWFSVDIAPSVGPEGFCGLPGTILGIATEDGGIVYFAKEIKAIKVSKDEFKYDLGKKKVYTLKEFKEKMKKDFSKDPRSRKFVKDLFRWL